jgi:hypothetical protein
MHNVAKIVLVGEVAVLGYAFLLWPELETELVDEVLKYHGD